MPCNYLASCPPGSSSALKWGYIIVYIITAGILFLLYQLQQFILKKWESNATSEKQYTKKKQDIKKLENIFDIEFEDLGLTLKNGNTVMSGVSGSLRSGRLCAVMGPSGKIIMIS